MRVNTKNPPGGWTASFPEITGGKTFGPHPQFGLIKAWAAKAAKKNRLKIDVEQRIHDTTGQRLVSQGHEDLVEGWEASPTVKRVIPPAEVVKAAPRMDEAKIVLPAATAARPAPVRRPRTLSEHFRGMKAYFVVKHREANGQAILTIPTEAERRAKICVSGAPGGKPCPMNIETEGESAIEQAEDEKMAAVVGGRKTKFDSLLGKCNVCSCRLPSLVQLMPQVIMVGTTPADMAKYPAFCWKHQLRI